MTTKKHIRQSFINDWTSNHQSNGKKAWLIKGDFDRFKLTNDLYGSLICDYLLDWTLDVIEKELRMYQKRLGKGNILWNFIGDDITIYIPPSSLSNKEICILLGTICDAIRNSFYRRYLVGAVPLPYDFFDDLSSEKLDVLRSELENMDVVFDFARRQCGYLILFPIDSDNINNESINNVTRVIQRRTGKAVPPLELSLNWIGDPAVDSWRQFNDGYLNPPSVSFAACSIKMEGSNTTVPYDRRSIYERFSLACQSALRVCKQQHMQILIQEYLPEVQIIHSAPQPAGGWTIESPLRWSSERYLRENLYFRQLEHPVLFQFNPVYHSLHHKFAAVIKDDVLRVEKYRGNQYGVGLKGINEIFGQLTADCLIVELMAAFSKVMQSTLIDKKIPPSGVHIARFVDRFTVFCEQPVMELPQIVDFVRQVAALFNAVSDEIKISQLRTGVVADSKNTIGYSLFHQLTLTSLSPGSIPMGDADLHIDVRQNRMPGTLMDGSVVLERNSYSSANQLDMYLDKHSLRSCLYTPA